MLSRPPALNESDNRGRGPVSVTPRPVLPLADQTGVFSSTTWNSSLPLPPPFSSSSSLSSSSAAPLLLPRSSLSSPSSSFICHPPPVSAHLMYISPPPPSSSAPEMAPSLFSFQPLNHTPPAPPTVSSLSSASFIPSHTSSFSSPSLTSTLPAHSSLSPSSSPATLSVLSLSSPLPPLLHSHTSCLVPSPPSALSTPHTAAVCSHPSPSSVHTSTPVSPLPPCPVAPPPACSCSSLLPRLLSAHRLEMRRLLRGALATLGRRLDTLERRSRTKKRKKGGAAASSPAASTPCSSVSIPLVTCSSSLDSEQSHTPALLSCLSQSEQSKEFRGRKRRRKNREDDDNEDEDPGRFVGQMAVSFRGGAEEASLTLHNVNAAKRRLEGGTGQSEKAVSVIGRRNGYRDPLSLHSSAPSLHLFQSVPSVRTCSQLEPFFVLSGQWWSSDFAPPRSSNPPAFSLWLNSSSSSPFSCRPASILRLSTDSVQTFVNLARNRACGSPLRPLKDWTAPPSLSGDHCYVQTPTQSSTLSTRRQQKQRANRSLHLPRRRPLALPPCSANGLSTPFPAGQSAAGSGFLSTNGEVELGKRVSQIRIRRASPKETLLTPMGLPKVKRLKKKEFSLEEIYTNKNFNHHPTTNRSLETIFEEPREKDGALLLIGQQRRRRLLLFPDFTQPRKRKRAQGAGLPIATLPRKRAAARRHCHSGGSSEDDLDLDVMLVERLSALEHFLTQQGLDV
ncbi:uncharacterized protein wu:fi75a02 isoform X2 [Solea solea]|uniref:uncharacterized protein wu:fi75a02 isoform X2 n=1 Tax=Solea solea TaxID=90069 RepID=UPI00272BAD40|nr:uncharacterized protein wu:fi75a02 isoform X2 [Solea solea]